MRWLVKVGAALMHEAMHATKVITPTFLSFLLPLVFIFFFLYTKKISPNSIDSEETQIELLAWPKSQSYM